MHDLVTRLKQGSVLISLFNIFWTGLVLALAAFATPAMAGMGFLVSFIVNGSFIVLVSRRRVN